jgi:hypothetical protein
MIQIPDKKDKCRSQTKKLIPLFPDLDLDNDQAFAN